MRTDNYSKVKHINITNMEDTKKKTVNTTITRNTAQFSQMTDNIYETVAVLTKRANQILFLMKYYLKIRSLVLLHMTPEI